MAGTVLIMLHPGITADSTIIMIRFTAMDIMDTQATMVPIGPAIVMDFMTGTMAITEIITEDTMVPVIRWPTVRVHPRIYHTGPVIR